MDLRKPYLQSSETEWQVKAEWWLVDRLTSLVQLLWAAARLLINFLRQAGMMFLEAFKR